MRVALPIGSAHSGSRSFIPSFRGEAFSLRSHRKIFLQLNAHQVAAAQARGFRFVPATPEQVARLTMQRRIFRVEGRDCLATSDSGYHETHGTLMAALTATELPVTEKPAPRTPIPASATAEPPPPTIPDGGGTVPLRLVRGRDGAASSDGPAPHELEEARAALRQEIVERATALGFTADALLPKRGGASAHDVPASGEPRSPAVKYRGTAPGETWTGRGRRPGWLVRLLEQGHDLKEFRV